MSFYFLTTGILLNACVVAFKEDLFLICVGLCGVGVLNTITYFLLERRSRELVRHSEDVLEVLEYSLLFPDSLFHELVNNGKPVGLLKTEREIGMREGTGRMRSLYKWARKTKVAIAFSQLIITSLFLAFGIYSIIRCCN